MSYAYEFANEALVEFRKLESWLAEEVLDELERLAARPPADGRRAPGGVVHDFTRDVRGDRYYVFLTLLWDHQRRIIHVSGLGQYVRREQSAL